MTDDPNRPIERTSLDGPAPEEWPPREWREMERGAERERDPERGQHLIWVALAAVICLVAWYGL